MSPKNYAIRRINAGSERFVLKAHFPHFTPELLFNYWIKPELVHQWLADDVQMVARLGGGFCLSWRDMNACMMGTYTYFEHGKRMAFNWHWAHEINVPTRNIALGFRPSMRGGASLMLMAGIYGKSPEERKIRRDHIDIWTYCLSRLLAVEDVRERVL
ncbi:MAG TPA: SRPBCC domain-containing protein [Oceanobacillus sp.]|nr:SRPBCC domain-containing protein [Oceanobacillus sp.]